MNKRIEFKLDNLLLASTGSLVPEISKPIFIICAPRSGSTFFYHSIRRMENVFSFGRENTPMWIRIFPYSRFSPPSDYVAPKECNPEKVRSLKSFILTKGIFHGFSFKDPNSRDFDFDVALKYFLMRQPIRYMEKTIANCFHLEAIEKVFPDAIFIHLVRDGRANVSSMIEGWDTFVKVGIDYSFPKNASIPYWSYAIPPGWQEVLHRPIEEICAWSWAEHNRYVLEKLDSDDTFKSRYLRVYYEDFVQDPFPIVDKVSSFCKLHISDECISYLKSKPLSRTTISQPTMDKWKQKNGEKIERVLDMIHPIMDQLGYTDFS